VEIVHGKPNPDIFLIAAQRFSDNPHPSKVCFRDGVVAIYLYIDKYFNFLYIQRLWIIYIYLIYFSFSFRVYIYI